MQNGTVGPAQPEPIVAESEVLQDIRRTKKEIEEGVRHLDHVDPARVSAMMKTFDLLIALHLRNPTCGANPPVSSNRRLPSVSLAESEPSAE